MTTLYRKYRPQTFANVIGQEHIIQTITNEIAANKVAHAYLFSGPRGVGKTTTARLLAKAVNCEKRAEEKFEPCDQCSSCEEITNGRSIDVMEIDAASQTGVDNVRENIIENAQFKPTKSKFKIFIIDEVHMLSASAFNALLKTLEEPPTHVIFILATTELHKLPKTIISRCQRFNFKKVPHELMLKRLKELCQEEEIKVEVEVLERVINKSDGCLRDAESLLGQVMSLGVKNITTKDVQMILPVSEAKDVLDFIEHLLTGQTKEALTAIEQVIESGVSIDNFCLEMTDVLRAIMITQTGLMDAANNFSSEATKKIKTLAKETQPEKITQLIEKVIKKRQEIKNSPIPQLPLEILAVEMNGENKSEEEKINPLMAKTGDEPSMATPAKTIKQTVQSAISRLAGHHAVKTKLEDVKDKWEELIQKISETNHSLTFILKMCQLQKIENGCLELCVSYSLHKQKIEEAKNKKAIEDNLLALFNERLGVICTLHSDSTAVNASKEKELIDIAAAFGGEIIG